VDARPLLLGIALELFEMFAFGKLDVLSFVHFDVRMMRELLRSVVVPGLTVTSLRTILSTSIEPLSFTGPLPIPCAAAGLRSM